MVPEGHHHWMLFLDLMHIVDILFAPVTSKGLAMYLKVLIRDFLEEFKALFPESSIIPKMHFMVHYPRCIVRLGPLVRHWCMRFEAKNSYFKRLSHGISISRAFVNHLHFDTRSFSATMWQRKGDT